MMQVRLKAGTRQLTRKQNYGIFRTRQLLQMHPTLINTFIAYCKRWNRSNYIKAFLVDILHKYTTETVNLGTVLNFLGMARFLKVANLSTKCVYEYGVQYCRDLGKNHYSVHSLFTLLYRISLFRIFTRKYIRTSSQHSKTARFFLFLLLSWFFKPWVFLSCIHLTSSDLFRSGRYAWFGLL